MYLSVHEVYAAYASYGVARIHLHDNTYCYGNPACYERPWTSTSSPVAPPLHRAAQLSAPVCTT